jgi:DNA (cytosine-5)-methyltransferase 1
VPKSVELFAGGGGMALGMHNAGFEHEQLVENNAHACVILRTNAERHPRLWKRENVREIDVRKWLSEAQGIGLEDIDLVAGGPPCQPFSISGKKAGRNDVRNMFPAAIETVRMLRPKMFVFENVPGLLRKDFLPYYEYIADQLRRPEIAPRDGEEEDWEKHHARIKKARNSGLLYHVFREEVNAADMGVPQLRKRVFLIGIRSDLLDEGAWEAVPRSHCQDSLIRSQWVTGDYWDHHGLAKPTAPPDRLVRKVRLLQESDGSLTAQRWRTTRDAIKGLPEPVDYQEAEGVLNHWGIPGARIYKGHTGSPIDWPSKTLKAGVHGVCGGEAMIRFSDEPLVVRYFTVREAANIQSFPDWYDVPGTRTAAMRALGNAVAVDVAEAIGKHLRRLTGI